MKGFSVKYKKRCNLSYVTVTSEIPISRFALFFSELSFKKSSRLYSSVFFLLFITSCSLVDFSPGDGIRTNPSRENQIIGENEAIYVSFDFAPEKTSAESLFLVNDYKGRVSGSFSWEGSRLLFTSDEKMIRGRRYVLDYSGSVSKKDGGEVKSEIVIPFFYMTSSCSVPLLSSVSPPAGNLIGRDEVLIFAFSKQMDFSSVEKGFKISPDTKHNTEWNADFSELKVTPDDGWKNLTSYTFSFSDDICCCDNIPLEAEYSFTYYCDSSHVKPEVLAVYTVLDNISLSWPRISDNLNTLKYREGLEVLFSVEMDNESVERSLSVTPCTPGRKFWKDEKSLIFIPDNGWQWNENYSLKISETAESADDVAAGSAYKATFNPDINELTLSSIGGKAADGFPVTTCSENLFLNIDTGPAPPHIYSFTFNFSESFMTDTEKEKLQSNINITALFPPDISSPFPVSYTWIGDNSLTVKYSGFTAYDSGNNIYYHYMLTLNGGDSGIKNNRGSFFQEDVKQALRTK